MKRKHSRAKCPAGPRDGFVSIRGAKEHNLADVDLDLPRGSLVVFTGVSGSGKSSLAYGTIYAEAQRRYLESVAPYARRLFHQMPVPEVEDIHGLPPAVALQQHRGAPSARSSVGSVTTLSNLLRILYSRAGDYPEGQDLLEAEAFSPNTPAGACRRCHGLGRIYDATEESMVPDDTLSIRERAIAAWPPAWHGTNLRDMLITLGYDIDKPWRKLPKNDRDWILFTEEQPVVPVFIGWDRREVRRALKDGTEPSYLGNFKGARRYLLDTFATTETVSIRKRVARYLVSVDCPECGGKRLRREALSVEIAGLDIAEMSRLPLEELAERLRSFSGDNGAEAKKSRREHPEKAAVAKRIVDDLISRVGIVLKLGLGYLSMDRATPTLSPGELQRLRLATQVRSNLFGVAYVMDEPSAGLHPADIEALLEALDALRDAGNSLFVVEHDLDVIRHADWIVDVGPLAGQHGGKILYSGPLEGLANVEGSLTRRHVFGDGKQTFGAPRRARDWLVLENISRNNLENLSVRFPIGVMTTVTGVSGSGKSSLVSQALVELVTRELGAERETARDEAEELERRPVVTRSGRIAAGMTDLRRLVTVDQRPIGRTPRSNLATYTGLFDNVRKLFAGTKQARSRGYDAGRFSFNVRGGRCDTCEGEGFVFVELLFLPGVYAPCPECRGARYNPETLEIRYREKTIADILEMTVESALAFFAEEARIAHALKTLDEIGLGYIRLGQPATELSGGESQRIKLATELQRAQGGTTLYVLDEPTTGLHPEDVEKLLSHLDKLVRSGNTVIVVEHDMRVAAASDWIVDLGPGAGDKGGRIVAAGPPAEVATSRKSRTAPYLDRFMTTRTEQGAKRDRNAGGFRRIRSDSPQ